MKQLTIGHHESDKATALEIQNNLEQVGIDVKLLSSELPGGEYLFERLQNSTSQSLVLISNAFFKRLQLRLQRIREYQTNDVRGKTDFIDYATVLCPR